MAPSLIFPVILLVVILAAIFIPVMYWRKRVESEIGVLQSAYRSLQDREKEQKNRIKIYLQYQRDPYQNLTRGISDQITQIDTELVEYRNQYVHAQQQLHRIAQGSRKQLLRSMFYWRQWRRLYYSVDELSHKEKAIDGMIVDAETRLFDLVHLAGKVVSDARNEITNLNQALSIVNQLNSRKFQGNAFDEIKELLKRIQDAFNRFPQDLLTSSEEVINQEISLEIICDLYDIVEQQKNILMQSLETLKRWMEQCQAADLEVAMLLNMLVQCEQMLPQLPDQISLTLFEQQISVLKTISKAMNDTLARLEAESLNEVINKARECQGKTREIIQDMKKTRRQQIALDLTRKAIADCLNDVSDKIADLGTRHNYSIAWDVSAGRLIALQKQENELIETGAREPGAIEQDYQLATEVLDASQELRMHCLEIESIHLELVRTLDTLNASYDEKWHNDIQNLIDDISNYDYANWPGNDAVQSFANDTETLEGKLHEAQLIKPSLAIRESNIPEMREKVLGTHEKYLKFLERKTNIQRRYIEIKNIEDHAKTGMNDLEAILNQIAFLVGSNQYLEHKAGKEVRKIYQTIEQLEQEIDTTSQGVVEKKDKKVVALGGKLEIKGNEWIQILDIEVDQQRNLLYDTLEKLDKIAKLEDGIVERARKLLLDVNRSLLRGELGEKRTFSELQELPRYLKLDCDYWQQLNAVIKELDETVGKPLIEAYNNFLRQQQDAIDYLKSTTTILPEIRSWPPTTLSLGVVNDELARNDSLHQAITSRKMRAIAAVGRYGEIAGHYRVLVARVTEMVKQAEQEQKRVTDLVREIEYRTALWERQEAVYSNDSQAYQQIRAMRAQAKSTINKLKQDWLNGIENASGEMTYDQIIRELVNTSRALNDSQIPFDDPHYGRRVVNINGQVH